jgi:hypothetical protein
MHVANFQLALYGECSSEQQIGTSAALLYMRADGTGIRIRMWKRGRKWKRRVAATSEGKAAM